MLTLKFDEFLRSLKQNKDMPHSLLLGAGASVESGIPSAADCIWDWKREIFLSQNPALIESYHNTKVDNVRIAIQKWLDSQRIYPDNGSEDEYSFYAEKAYPIEDDRRKYFQHLVADKNPSLGYHLISMLSEIGWIKSVWTTNFDGCQ
jgi:NAD-dependent SIR2 family protein deacetylase